MLLAKRERRGYQAASLRGDGRHGGRSSRVRAPIPRDKRRTRASEWQLSIRLIPPGENPAPYDEAAHDPRRRDFINIAAVAWAGVGAASIVLPLVNQMNPSADVLAQSTTEIDMSAIQPGRRSRPASASSRCSSAT